jgi:hypothetical protein
MTAPSGYSSGIASDRVQPQQPKQHLPQPPHMPQRFLHLPHEPSLQVSQDLLRLPFHHLEEDDAVQAQTSSHCPHDWQRFLLPKPKRFALPVEQV